MFDNQPNEPLLESLPLSVEEKKTPIIRALTEGHLQSLVKRRGCTLSNYTGSIEAIDHFSECI